MTVMRFCPRHEFWTHAAHEWTTPGTGQTWVTLGRCGCTLPVNGDGKPCLTVQEARKVRAGRRDGPRKPTWDEQNPSYRSAMRDSGRGGLLP